MQKDKTTNPVGEKAPDMKTQKYVEELPQQEQVIVTQELVTPKNEENTVAQETNGTKRSC